MFMYLGVDIGGTKTLVATLDDKGVIKAKNKFPTPKNYTDFLKELAEAIKGLNASDFKACGVGIAGRIDRKHGRRFASGKLQWDNVPILSDVEKIAVCPTALENDAKLAGLSEAMLLKSKFRRVLYTTVSTGIGYALIVDQIIDTNIGDDGGNTILIPRAGKLQSWESFASGRAIVERYGKKAKDIHDEKTWAQVARDLSHGLVELIAITEPQAIVFGGSVGAFFDRLKDPLSKELKKYETPLLNTPQLLEACRPNEAVVYGCYDLARLIYG